MKHIVNISIAVAVVSLIVGLIARIMLLPVGTIGLLPRSFLQFTNTCLLLAITFILLQILRAKG